MLLTIPYQAFEVENVHLLPFEYNKYNKRIARLNYHDASIQFQDITILSPPMKVIDYYPKSLRLRVDISEFPLFQHKLHNLLEYIIRTFYVQQYSFLHEQNKSLDYIHRLFYPLLDKNILSLYIHPRTKVIKRNGISFNISKLELGDVIRCAISIKGISHMMMKDKLQLRIYHSVPSIWMIE